MRILNLKQNTPEWEAFRQTVVGASDIGILMEGSEREIYELLQVKRGLAKKYVTKAMQHGSDTEEEAIEYLIGRRIPSSEKICAIPDDIDWLMASFDYIDLDGDLQAEVKCPQFVHSTLSEHSHYKRWWWQVQAQLSVSGRSKALLLAYSAITKTKEWVERDEAAITKLREKAKWFYELMINFEDLPVPNEVVERYDNQAVECATLFQQIDEKIKELEEEKKVLRDELIAIADDTPFVCNGVKVTKQFYKESIDYEAACKAHGIDTTAYKKKPKTAFTWRISAS